MSIHTCVQQRNALWSFMVVITTQTLGRHLNNRIKTAHYSWYLLIFEIPTKFCSIESLLCCKQTHTRSFITWIAESSDLLQRKLKAYLHCIEFRFMALLYSPIRHNFQHLFPYSGNEGGSYISSLWRFLYELLLWSFSERCLVFKTLFTNFLISID